MATRTRARKRDPKPVVANTTTTTAALDNASTFPDALPIPAVDKSAIVQASIAAATIRDEVIVLASTLNIQSADDYHVADDLLHKINVALKRTEDPFEDVIGRVRPGLDQIYAIRRAIQNPLLDLQVTVKEKMRVWQIAERKRVENEQRERDRLEQLERQRQKELDAAQTTDTPLLPGQYEISVLPHLPPVTPPTRAASSSARTVKRWRVTDFSLLVQAVNLGMVPETVLQVNESVLNNLLRVSPGDIDTYPGMETWDDVIISGR